MRSSLLRAIPSLHTPCHTVLLARANFRPVIHAARRWHTTHGSAAPVDAKQDIMMGPPQTALRPLAQYDSITRLGSVRADNHQRGIIQHLDDLWQDLKNYESQMIGSSPGSKNALGSFSHWLGYNKVAKSRRRAPKSVYIYGDVGTGKTMVMDLFFDTLPLQRKRRVHFHAFMLEIHARIHNIKTSHPRLDNPLAPIADDLIRDAYVLCFDEFQVTDIADAMILRKLFAELFDRGVVLVTTSNRHPTELYKNGIQRTSFLPCIDLLMERCHVLSLDSGTDYRKMEREPATSKVFFHPLDGRTRQSIDAITARLTHHKPMAPKSLHFLGRTLVVPAQVDGVARIPFSEACAGALSATDYLAIVKEFHTIILTDIPKMTMKHRAEARRFITFIDAMYEAKVTLIASAESNMMNLFNANEDTDAAGADDATRMLMDDLKLTDISSPLFTGQEEAFAFQRALSRLIQMQSKEWVNKELS